MKLIINPAVNIKFKNNEFRAHVKGRAAYVLSPIAYFICRNADGKHTADDVVVALESDFKKHRISVPEDLDLDAEIKRAANILSMKGIVFIE